MSPPASRSRETPRRPYLLKRKSLASLVPAGEGGWWAPDGGTGTPGQCLSRSRPLSASERSLPLAVFGRDEGPGSPLGNGRPERGSRVGSGSDDEVSKTNPKHELLTEDSNLHEGVAQLDTEIILTMLGDLEQALYNNMLGEFNHPPTLPHTRAMLRVLKMYVYCGSFSQMQAF